MHRPPLDVTHTPTQEKHASTKQMPNGAADVESELETLRNRVEAALGTSLDEQWDEVLGQWEEASPADRDEVRAQARALRDRLLDSLRAIGSLEELKRGLAIGYIEMKCHWTMLNTRIQQQTAQHGRPKEPLIYRATCVSLIVQGLEPLLNREYVEGVADLLADPLSA